MKGHFEKGVWVEEKIPDEKPEIKGEPIGDRIEKTQTEISQTIGNVISLTRDLFTTEEGRKHIQKKIDNAGTQLDSAIRDIMSQSEKATKPEKEKKKEGK